jgi:hypothetical protein
LWSPTPRSPCGPDHCIAARRIVPGPIEMKLRGDVFNDDCPGTKFDYGNQPGGLRRAVHSLRQKQSSSTATASCILHAALRRVTAELQKHFPESRSATCHQTLPPLQDRTHPTFLLPPSLPFPSLPFPPLSVHLPQPFRLRIYPSHCPNPTPLHAPGRRVQPCASVAWRPSSSSS